MGSGSRDSSSSSSEDGDAEWRAAIDSVATNGSTENINNQVTKNKQDYEQRKNSQTLKLYQIKAQKLLDDILEKSLVAVRNSSPVLDDNPLVDEGGIRLFRHAPCGIIIKPIDELQGPKKKPRILPGAEIDEKSKKFRRQLQSVAVDGADIIAAARDSCQKSLARFEAKDAAAKAAAKREEERVAKLKRIRGEKWLPSIARDMQYRF